MLVLSPPILLLWWITQPGSRKSRAFFCLLIGLAAERLSGGPFLESRIFTTDGVLFHTGYLGKRRAVVRPFKHRCNRLAVALYHRLDAAIGAIHHPTADPELFGLLLHRFAKPHALNAAVNQEMKRLAAHFTFMPGWAPESGDRMNSPGASPEAASTMPSLMPNFILRGARLATITVSRPTSASGA